MVRVRQITLRLGPDEFIGIEFGCVARKAVCLHAGMAAEKDLDVPTPMNPPAVPQQDEKHFFVFVTPEVAAEDFLAQAERN